MNRCQQPVAIYLPKGRYWVRHRLVGEGLDTISRS